jgi:hypothetical protein
MKTNKHRTLGLVKKRGAVHSRDLVEEFDYTPGTARSYLSHLGRQGLLEGMGVGYQLTTKGENRLHHFDVFGCADINCPLCQGKLGFISCPHCGSQMRKTEAKILKERDYLFVTRQPGVYCNGCGKLIFTEVQGRLLGIPSEG